MAYIRKKGKGWQYTVNIGIDPVTGERKQKAKGGFKTKKEAQIAAAILEQEIANKTYIPESNKTFEQFVDEWLHMYEHSGKVKISTVRVRKHESDNLKPYFAKLKLVDITKTMYQNALNDLKTKFAENTLSGIHSTGRMIFKKALEMDLIKNDPTKFAYVPKSKKTIEEIEQEENKIKYLEKNELAKFLRTAKEDGLPQDYIIFLLLSYTGMRAGELCALKWKDIDLEEGTINITKTYYNPTNNTMKYQILTPKTESSKRSIEIDDTLVRALEEHKRLQNELKMRFRKTYYDQDFVITKIDNYPGYPEMIKVIENRMRRLLKKSGLPETLTPHSLRHTHVSLLAEAGVGLQEIMDRLGHKDDDVTRNVYWHVTKTRKKEAAQKFAELMNGL